MSEQYTIGSVGDHAFIMQGENLSLVQNNATPFFHRELDEIKSLIGEKRAKAALAGLNSLRKRIWDSADNEVRYRILHYEGSALLHLYKNTEAAYRFIDAYNLKQNDKDAQAFRSLAYLLLGDRIAAFEYSQALLKQHRSESLGYQVLVQAAPAELEYEEVLNLVPDLYRNDPAVQYAIARRMYEQGNLEIAEVHTRNSLATPETDTFGAGYGLLGTLILVRAFAEFHADKCSRKTKHLKQRVSEGESALSSAWQRVASTELADVGVEWLLNRANARRFLERSGAIEDLNAAQSIAPDLDLSSAFVGILMDSGQYAKAIEILTESFEKHTNLQDGLLLFAFLIDENRLDEAFQIKQALEHLGIPEAQQESFDFDVHRLEVKRENLEGVEVVVARIVARKPETVEAFCVLSDYERMKGNDNVSERLLDAAVDAINKNTSFRELYVLSVYLRRVKHYDNASRVLEMFVDKDSLDPQNEMVRTLLDVYIRSGKLQKALDLALYLLDMHGPMETVSLLAVRLLVKNEKFDAAKTIAERYLAKVPNDFGMRLEHALVCYDLEDDASIDDFLKLGFNIDELTLTQAFNIVSLYIYRKNNRLAIELAYEARLMFEDEPEAHRKYIGLFLQGIGDGPEVDWLYPESVNVDTIVQGKKDDGNDFSFLIEERTKRKKPLTDLLPSQALAQELLGASKGDKVIVRKSSIVNEMGVITEIKSKFIAAFHESTLAFGTAFPEDKTFKLVRFPLPTEENV